jgi:Ca2+-binding EF-hand superfamily protein
MSRLSRLIVAVALNGSLAAPLAFVAMNVEAYAASPIATYDTDKDGTLDIAEVKKAAGATFDKLDKDNDATVDRKEVGGRMTGKEFAAGDPDNDKTLSKDEYLAIVEQLFKAADRDNDGTLSAAELHSKAGRALLRLLK